MRTRLGGLREVTIGQALARGARKAPGGAPDGVLERFGATMADPGPPLVTRVRLRTASSGGLLGKTAPGSL